MLIKNTVLIVSKVITVSVIGLSGLMTSNIVSAESKTIVGSGCLARDDSQTNLMRSRFGPLENRDTGITNHRIVLCHVPVGKGDHYGITGKVRVIDASNTYRVLCSLRTNNFNGNFLASSTENTSIPGINTRGETLSFNDVYFERNGASYISCTIPPVDMGRVSSIVSVNVNNKSDN